MTINVPGLPDSSDVSKGAVVSFDMYGATYTARVWVDRKDGGMTCHVENLPDCDDPARVAVLDRLRGMGLTPEAMRACELYTHLNRVPMLCVPDGSGGVRLSFRPRKFSMARAHIDAAGKVFAELDYCP